MQADLANKAHRAHERLKYIKQKNIRKHCSPPQPHPIPSDFNPPTKRRRLAQYYTNGF